MSKRLEVFCFAALSVLAVSCPAQVFKGHRIGETFADFVKVEPAIQAKLTSCQTNIPHQLTPDEIAKLTPDELRSRYGAWAKNMKQYLKIENDYNKPGSFGAPSKRDEEQQEYQQRCGALLTLFANGNGEVDGLGSSPLVLSQEYDENHRDFVFKAGVLVKFSMILRAYYADARDDITQRMGVKPTEVSAPYHNAFGAAWNNFSAEWNNDKLHVVLSQSNNPASPSNPDFLVEAEELYKRSVEQVKSTPKPLD